MGGSLRYEIEVGSPKSEVGGLKGVLYVIGDR